MLELLLLFGLGACVVSFFASLTEGGPQLLSKYREGKASQDEKLRLLQLDSTSVSVVELLLLDDDAKVSKLADIVLRRRSPSYEAAQSRPKAERDPENL